MAIFSLKKAALAALSLGSFLAEAKPFNRREEGGDCSATATTSAPPVPTPTGGPPVQPPAEGYKHVVYFTNW